MSSPSKTSTRDSIVALAETVTSDEPSEIVQSNIAFINLLFEEYLKLDEISPDALRSYYVDFFLAQFENGGFSQFVYNTNWDPEVVAYVREGLQAMKAKRYLKAFDKGAKIVESFGKEGLKAYLNGEYFGENEDRDELGETDEAINAAGEKEDIAQLHFDWLSKHPQLFPLQTEEDLKAEARRRGEALPDRAQRVAAAYANEPRPMKLIRLLCAASGQELDRQTAASAVEFEGTKTFAYHFLTDQGHHHMIEHNGKAIMLRGHTSERVATVDAPEDLRPN